MEKTIDRSWLENVCSLIIKVTILIHNVAAFSINMWLHIVPNNEKLGKNGMKESVYVFLAAQQNLIFTSFLECCNV